MNYLYDGTFDGFLTCVHEHYYAAKADGILAPGAYQPDILISSRAVQTDEAKARKVEEAVRDKISPHALARVYRVFRTNTEGKEMLLLNYIRFCFKHGSGAAFLHSHPLVNPVANAELKIGNEVHRLCGLIRFSAVAPAASSSPDTGAASFSPPVTASPPDTGAASFSPPATASSPDTGAASFSPPATSSSPEILYARISPDHEVLEFLAPHFTDRFKSDPFIIHDTKRGRALIAWHRRWHIEDFTEQDAALFANTANEEAYRGMWRKYFDTIAIKERTNPRCQRNFMPARYWQNLPEMQIRE
ncbi:MAG: TIGR03915 family putative DNA repair protein [Clostridiales Family XIII bacterium]|jgi:hypothetical protein|nr:TIGR03915 family putative DNA repair protein [Clostridiales Family XIII bacterium]